MSTKEVAINYLNGTNYMVSFHADSAAVSLHMLNINKKYVEDLLLSRLS